MVARFNRHGNAIDHAFVRPASNNWDLDSNECAFGLDDPDILTCGYREDEHNMTPREQVGGDHYQLDGIQPIDLIRSAGLLVPFAQGNIIKYAARLFRKESSTPREKAIEDLKKIQQYAQFAIDYLESEETFNG